MKIRLEYHPHLAAMLVGFGHIHDKLGALSYMEVEFPHAADHNLAVAEWEC